MATEATSPIQTNQPILPTISRRLPSQRKKSIMSISNRFKSIREDGNFAVETMNLYPGMLGIANQRCGSWYLPPGRTHATSYFKSTDGHHGQWAFSKRRLNLQVLDAVIKSNNTGLFIVDSTRKGKTMPDAFANTIPIWCYVMNKLLFPEHLLSEKLWAWGGVDGTSDRVGIWKRLKGFVRDGEALNLNLEYYRKKLTRPLVSFPSTRDSPVSPIIALFKDQITPIILCTASRPIPAAESLVEGYIQGAADDSEYWAQGLTPNLYWRYETELCETSDADLPELIFNIIASEKSLRRMENLETHQPTKIDTTNFYIGTLPDIDVIEGYHGVVICSDDYPYSVEEEPKTARRLWVQCGEGKAAGRTLRDHLDELVPFLKSLDLANGASVLFACPTGKDISVGIALIAFCLFYEEEDNSFIGDTVVYEAATNSMTHLEIDKNLILRRLAHITGGDPEMNPSRATLQSVHAFLMSEWDSKIAGLEEEKKKGKKKWKDKKEKGKKAAVGAGGKKGDRDEGGKGGGGGAGKEEVGEAEERKKDISGGLKTLDLEG